MLHGSSIVLPGLAVLLAALPANAHHPMDGAIPSNLAEGFLSGLGHPVIGIDHLAFLLAAGLVAAVFRLGLWLPAVFVAASIGGVALHVLGLDLPLAELVIGASVLGIGAALATAWAMRSTSVWAAGFAVAGLFHGHAYGESIIGAEATPLVAYLAGLALVQTAIGVGAAVAASRARWTAETLAPRLAGAAACGVAVTVLAGMI